MTMLYLCRHGECEANVSGEFSNRGLIHPLTALGRQQAAALAQNLASLSVSHIVSSPLLRARQTADIVSSVLGLPYGVDEGLREFDCGILEGRADDAAWRIYTQVADGWMTHQEWDLRIDGGESLREVVNRLRGALRRILETAQRTPGNCALIGHGGTYRVALPALLANVSWSFAAAHPLGNGEMVIVDARNGDLVALRWGPHVLP